MKDKFIKAHKYIEGARKILLVTHFHPDGDALAATCALLYFLDRRGKTADGYCHDDPPRQFDFLPQIEKISSRKPDLRAYDLVIVVDCGGLNRTKLEEEIRKRPAGQKIIEFDHHPRTDEYADLELRDPAAASTTEVVYRFFRANRIRIDKNAATCIMTGLITDTAFFLYPSTTRTTVEAAAEMLRRGARFSEVKEYAWRNKNLATLRIWGKAIDGLKINERYKLAFSVLTRDDLAGEAVSGEELEGIAGFMSNLAGVKALLFLREENGLLRGSLRAGQSDVNVARLAARLGGGGHPKAAGFTLSGRLEKTEKGWKVS